MIYCANLKFNFNLILSKCLFLQKFNYSYTLLLLHKNKLTFEEKHDSNGTSQLKFSTTQQSRHSKILNIVQRSIDCPSSRLSEN